MSNFYKDNATSDQRRKFAVRIFKAGLQNIVKKSNMRIAALIVIAAEIVAAILCGRHAEALEGLERFTAKLDAVTIIAGSVLADIALIFLAGKPFKALRYNKAFAAVGLVNKNGEPPVLTKEEPYSDKDYGNCIKQTYLSNGISYDMWYDARSTLETALEVHILYINVGAKVNIIEIIVTSPDASLPEFIEWDDSHLPDNDAVYVLGKALPDRDLTYNTDNDPNLLVASVTGGGKTNFLRSQIQQALKRNVKVVLIDKKRGIDYKKNITDYVTLMKEDEEIAVCLQDIVDEMNRRFDKIAACAGANNIKEYRQQGYRMQRILIVVDELAQLTQRKSASAAEKKVTDSIVLSLSRIAQLGRAVGITLLLATQRPSEDVLPRQVASNINVRVCGKADENLSRVVFGDGRADKTVPKNIKGRFMTDDGTIFQAYFYK